MLERPPRQPTRVSMPEWSLQPTDELACNYFNVFNLTTPSGGYYAMYCQLYSYDTSAAADPGIQSLVGYPVVGSYGYALYPPDSGKKAVSWTPAPIGTAASCASLGNGKNVTDYNNVQYTLACGYDVQYVGDIGNATAPDFYSCMNLCDNISACSGFAYLGNVCYFKNVTGATSTPQVASGVDLAWNPSKYAGFNAGSIPNTVRYTTITQAWTGTARATTTSYAGLTGYVIVQTPGTVAKASTVTSYFDSGTATTIGTSTTSGSGTTTVNVYYPTPTYCTTVVGNGNSNTGVSNSGARYAFYSNAAAGSQGPASYPAYQPTTVKTRTPLATGVSSYIGESNTDGQSVVIYGQSARLATTLVISHTFYLYAGRGTGYYNFYIPYTDDVQFVWIGSKALSGWTRANADILQYWSSGIATQTPQTLAYYLTFGTYTPVRIQWGNGGGAGDMRISITGPDGQAIVTSGIGTNSGYMAPHIVTSPCDKSLGAQFPNFGAET